MGVYGKPLGTVITSCEEHRTWFRFFILAAVLAAAWAVPACGSDEQEVTGPGPIPDAGAGGGVDGSVDGGLEGGGDAAGGGPAVCNADDPFEWPLPTEQITITPSATWKNQVSFPEDDFLSPSLGPGGTIRWVKFAVLVRDPTKVYFQSSSSFEFHYDFAVQQLDPFMGLSHAEFDQISLYQNDQEVILGAVLFPPRAEMTEFAIQLVRQDAYHPEMAHTIIDLVAANIVAPDGTTVLYVPTFEQSPSTVACTDWYAAQGIVVDTIDRWSTANTCYADGWALGRLVSVAGADIDTAYAAGTLLPTDILLTDAVPAEIPFVAGILTKQASTPNSHVAILARSYGVPFAHLALQEDADLATSLVGKEIVLRAENYYDQGCTLRIIDVDGAITPADHDAILALKAPPALTLQSITSYGAYSASTTGLTSDDVKYFGGKAAGFGLLREVIPSNSPVAIAFSFDLWTEFLGQTMGTGKTLRVEIDDRLAGFTYPPNVAQVQQVLDEIRTLIKDQAVFSSVQQQAIFSALASFDGNKKIRFRSSTNVEDTEHFVGAGLYSSYSGCLADDQDADDLGPSLCDSSKAKERGVLRAIRKVFASFYNDNAFLERLRYGVDESVVGMALLVHHSFPDETELANGVATGETNSFSSSYDLITQKGAVSVANPSDGAQPEWVSVYASGMGGIYPTFEQGSSLVPLGATVLEWPSDYEQLSVLLKSVSDQFALDHPILNRFVLDFEYKQIVPGDLVVKQVRQLPIPDPNATWPVYLVNEPSRYCVFQGEHGHALANHRLKSVWDIATKNQWLDATSLQQSFYDTIGLEYLDGTTVSTLTGDPTSFTNPTHLFDGSEVADGFSLGTGGGQRGFTIKMQVSTEVPKTQSPLRSIRDHLIMVDVNYTTPVPTIDWTGVTTTDYESVMLGTCPDDNVVTSINPFVEETINAGGITVETSYYHPPLPTGITVGYTAPLFQWKQTTISGLTTTPIVLTGYYSQTYRPGHHNFANDYVFDPWLESGISTTILDELQSKNIRLLYIEQSSEVWTLSLDGVLQQVL